MSSTVCIAELGSPPSPCMSPPRSLTTTLAPSLAKSSACSRPMPRPAPVMMATRPSSWFTIASPWLCRRDAPLLPAPRPFGPARGYVAGVGAEERLAELGLVLHGPHLPHDPL